MTKLRLVLAAAALLFGAVSISAPAQANLITNGGFETGDLTGWTASGELTFMGVDEDDPHSGTYGFYSGAAYEFDFIEQNLATVAGATYRLTYWLASRERRNQTRFLAEWDGVEVDSFLNVNPFGYSEFSFDLVAVDDLTTLRFGFMHFFDYWVLDDVSVELVSLPVLVPEPGTLALFGAALLGMTAARRRNRR